MISMTGINEVRMDSKGSGKYGARRKNRYHKGTDYLGIPGNPAIAPIDGNISREAKPYANEDYSGFVIVGVKCTIKAFYFKLDKALIGKSVLQGDIVGVIQDISERSGNEGMRPHIHQELVGGDLDVFVNGF